LQLNQNQKTLLKGIGIGALGLVFVTLLVISLIHFRQQIAAGLSQLTAAMVAPVVLLALLAGVVVYFYRKGHGKKVMWTAIALVAPPTILTTAYYWAPRWLLAILAALVPLTYITVKNWKGISGVLRHKAANWSYFVGGSLALLLVLFQLGVLSPTALLVLLLAVAIIALAVIPAVQAWVQTQLTSLRKKLTRKTVGFILAVVGHACIAAGLLVLFSQGSLTVIEAFAGFVILLVIAAVTGFVGLFGKQFIAVVTPRWQGWVANMQARISAFGGGTPAPAGALAIPGTPLPPSPAPKSLAQRRVIWGVLTGGVLLAFLLIGSIQLRVEAVEGLAGMKHTGITLAKLVGAFQYPLFLVFLYGLLRLIIWPEAPKKKGPTRTVRGAVGVSLLTIAGFIFLAALINIMGGK
jgi:hypothetical protein